MSDLLAATGWVGEHPATGQDVAHLLLYPATDLDADSAAKIAAIARLWDLSDATATRPIPTADLVVDVDHGTLAVPAGEAVPLPGLNPTWTAAARRQGFVVVSLTAAPLAAPTLPVIEDLLAGVNQRDLLWLGFAPVAR